MNTQSISQTVLNSGWHVDPRLPSAVFDANRVTVADHCTAEHAKLIAASPSLLESLKSTGFILARFHGQLVDECKNSRKPSKRQELKERIDRIGEVLKRANEAITNAEGRAP